jgi:hypothetical protein
VDSVAAYCDIFLADRVAGIALIPSIDSDADYVSSDYQPNYVIALNHCRKHWPLLVKL